MIRWAQYASIGVYRGTLSSGSLSPVPVSGGDCAASVSRRLFSDLLDVTTRDYQQTSLTYSQYIYYHDVEN